MINFFYIKKKKIFLKKSITTSIYTFIYIYIFNYLILNIVYQIKVKYFINNIYMH